MDPAVERKNGNIFFWTNLLIYLAAPVFYVGVLQAALCDKLGTSATLANLPSVGYFCASFAPMIFACIVPHRLERSMVVLTGWLTAGLCGLVAVVLVLPMPNIFRIGVVVGQALVLGVFTSINMLFLLQCLGRGTTDLGRARALKLTYTFGPLAAVAGSLLAQFIIAGGIHFLRFPFNFAALYLIAVPCAGIGAWCCGRFELEPMPEEAGPRPGFFHSLRGSFQRYLHSRTLIRLWFAYAVWYSAFMALSNLSLYTRHALGREPATFSGIITAIQFGSKAISGYALGILYLRRGVRAPLIATVAFLGVAMIWAWTMPGYAFLATFAFIGAGQLGGIYFPNVLLSWSPASTAVQDLAVLGLTTIVASPVPAVYGMITDHWGFPPSFALGLAFAVIGLILVLSLPTHQERPTSN